MEKHEIPQIFVDMTVGNESSRISKVRHQGFTETVHVLNGVLKKMNADVKLEIERLNAPTTFEIPDFPEPNGKHHPEVATSDS